MKLLKLEIAGVRNLSSVSLDELSRVNVFYGDNGAGKTSVLEAIHILGLARSFRSTQLHPVIQYSADRCTVFGSVEPEDGAPAVSLGVERARRGGFRIRVDGQDEKALVKLADAFPIQLINANSYSLLEGGPKRRRQFMDWGVFHVEHRFYEMWKRLQRSVKQRNCLLRGGKNTSSEQELAMWDRELSEVGEQIDAARQSYLEMFLPVFLQQLEKLVDVPGLTIEYLKGWDAKQDLAGALQDSRERDFRRGITHKGPHRSDLAIRVNGIDAGQVLSRGQQKLVVCALRLAQCRVLLESRQKKCVLLIDDLPAEIDLEHQARLCDLLYSLDMQLFMTCVSPESLLDLPWNIDEQFKLFHVEHGIIKAG